MFSSNSNNDSDSIDFEFFETEGGQIKTYSNNQNSSSKIITQAVIETNPLSSLDFFKSTRLAKNTSNEVQDLKNNQQAHKVPDHLSGFVSADEKHMNGSKLDESMLSSPSYNDEDEYDDIDSNSSFSEDRDSDNFSMSESTIDTSDFTSVSPLSFTSDSNLQSDELVDSLKPQNTTENCLDGVAGVDGQKKTVKYDNEDDCESRLSSKSEEQNKNVAVNNNNYEENSNSTPESDMNYQNDFEDENDNSNSANGDSKESIVSVLGEELEDISLSQKSSSSLCSMKIAQSRSSSKLRFRKKETNLTFSREEQIKIERDNMILLKKIMSHAKPRSVSLNHSSCHKKTSAAINRAKQQKKIEHDNYILYTKISALARTKKVC